MRDLMLAIPNCLHKSASPRLRGEDRGEGFSNV